MKNDGKNVKNASGGDHPSPDSHSSHPIIPPRGDYQTLLSYQKAEVMDMKPFKSDAAAEVCFKALDPGDSEISRPIKVEEVRE